MTTKTIIVLAASCALLLGSVSAFAAGDAAAGKQKSATCAACHGADGNSTNAQYPKLAGQHASYLYKELKNFKQGKRVNVIMQGMVKSLSDKDMQDLAAYFSQQTIKPGVADPKLVAQGEQLYRGGDAKRGIPACSGCHGPAGRGNPLARFPRLAGQHAEYVASQLKMFRSRQRANDPNGMMRGVAANMTDQEIAAVASYIQGLRH